MSNVDLGGVARQAQKMRKDLEAVRRDLAQRVVEGTAGGAAVRVYVNGRREVQGVKIDPAVVCPDDVEMLEDLVTTALRDGLRAAEALSREVMEKAGIDPDLAGSP